MKIIQADVTDVDDIYRIETQSFKDPWTKKELRRALKYPNTKGFVAFCDIHFAGYILVHKEGKELEIANIAVAPEFRRASVGRKLVAEAEKMIPCKKLVALDVEHNLPAQIFFREIGFTCSGICHDEYETQEGEYQDAYRFERESW